MSLEVHFWASPHQSSEVDRSEDDIRSTSDFFKRKVWCPRSGINCKEGRANLLRGRKVLEGNFVPYMFVDCVDLAGEGDVFEK